MTGELILAREIDGLVVGQRKSDGYVNGTSLSKAAGKKLNDYTRLDTTREFLQELEAVTGIPVTELVQTRQGGTPADQGTWVHPRVAVDLARWCSSRFAVQVSAWVEELLTTGRVELARPSSGDHIIDKLELSRQYLDSLIETRKQQIALGQQVQAAWEQVGLLTVQVDRAEAKADAALKQANGTLGYCSIQGWYRRADREVTEGVAAAHGKRLTAVCRAKGVEVHRIKDSRHGFVHTYPESELEAYFAPLWASGKP